jgi:hypothetical protein
MRKIYSLRRTFTVASIPFFLCVVGAQAQEIYRCTPYVDGAPVYSEDDTAHAHPATFSLTTTPEGYDMTITTRDNPPSGVVLHYVKGPMPVPTTVEDLKRGFGYSNILEYSGIRNADEIAAVELYRFDHNWTDDARYIVYKDKNGRPLSSTFVQSKPIICKF